jgi:hypothetical protein
MEKQFVCWGRNWNFKQNSHEYKALIQARSTRTSGAKYCSRRHLKWDNVFYCFPWNPGKDKLERHSDFKKNYELFIYEYITLH